LPKKTLISWSTGKDSSWMLYRLLQDPCFDVSGLFCTVNQEFSRTAMHAVRVELLHIQAEMLGLPLSIIEIPNPCSNAVYEQKMGEFMDQAVDSGVKCIAFGDLFLEDIRAYREQQFKDTGIEPIFPIWKQPTKELAREMIEGGLRALVTCIDPKQMPAEFAGKEFDESFLDSLPDSVDPCGENGEFHTFVYDSPSFRKRIEISLGEIVHRDGFVFADLVPMI
jgi:uncharacterized protein (TIGR00290 family)